MASKQMQKNGRQRDNTGAVFGLGEELQSRMRLSKFKLAQVDDSTNSSDTYGQLLSRSLRIAESLHGIGVQSGDVIVVASTNHLDACVPYLAGLFIGAKIANFEATTREDAIELFRQLEPRVVFASPDYEECVEYFLNGTRSKIVVFGETTRNMTFKCLLKETQTVKRCRVYRPTTLKETVFICYTYGNTHRPKGACITHQTVLYQCQNFSYRQNEGVTYSTLPVMSTIGLHYLFATLYHGYCRIIVPATDLHGLRTTIQTYKVDYLLASTLNLTGEQSVIAKDQIPSIRLIEVTDASSKTLSTFQTSLPYIRMNNLYAITQVFGPIMDNTFDDSIALMNAGTIGRARPDVKLKVVDQHGKELGINENGELRIKLQHQMKGYYRTISPDLWDSEGWIKTGDICYYNEELFFFLVEKNGVL